MHKKRVNEWRAKENEKEKERRTSVAGTIDAGKRRCVIGVLKRKKNKGSIGSSCTVHAHNGGRIAGIWQRTNKYTRQTKRRRPVLHLMARDFENRIEPARRGRRYDCGGGGGGESRMEMERGPRLLFRDASRELIPRHRIANNRRCSVSRPVTPRVQQRDCSRRALVSRATVSSPQVARQNNNISRELAIDCLFTLRFDNEPCVRGSIVAPRGSLRETRSTMAEDRVIVSLRVR